MTDAARKLILHQGSVQSDDIIWSGTAESLLTRNGNSTVTSVISFNGVVGVTQYILRVNYQSHFLALSTNLPYFSNCSKALTSTANTTMYPDH